MAIAYATYLTPAGVAAMANAITTGTSIKLTSYALGDGAGFEYPSDPANTGLKNEVYRDQLNDVYISPDNPDWLVAEFIVTAEVGGFSIREVALLDDQGVALVLGSTKTIGKPLLSEGSGLDIHAKIIIALDNTALVTLMIDPSTVLATRAYVDSVVQGVAQGRPVSATFTGDGTTTNYPVSQLQASDPTTILVTVDGVEQRWITDYTLVLTTYTTVVFANAPAAGTLINIRTFTTLSQSGLSAPIPLSVMSRDGQGRSQVVDGVAAQDIANVGQINSASTTLIKDIQGQLVNAFTTTGVQPAFTVATNPAYGGLANGQRFRITFHAASAGNNPNLNRDGLGAKPIMQYSNTGALVAATISAGMLSDIEYNNNQYILLDPLPPAGFTMNRTVQVNLASGNAVTDTGTNIQPGVMGILPAANGGTGVAGTNNLLVNLSKSQGDNVFQQNPAPGVTGTLAVTNGGTGLVVDNALIVDLTKNNVGDSVFKNAPRPGVIGILPPANGGTGVSGDNSLIVDLTKNNAGDSVFKISPRPGVTGILPAANGGTGVAGTNNLLVDLTKTAGDNVFQPSPKPGVSGILPIGNGGTGASNAATACTNLGCAPLNSPAFSGTPTGPTPAAGDNSTKLATTAFVNGSFLPTVKNKFAAYTGGYNQNIPAGSRVQVQFTQATINTSNEFNTSSSVFTPSVSGYYIVGASIATTSSTPASYDFGILDGGVVVSLDFSQNYVVVGTRKGSTLCYLTAGSQLSVYYQTSAGDTILGNNIATNFWATRVG